MQKHRQRLSIFSDLNLLRRAPHRSFDNKLYFLRNKSKASLSTATVVTQLYNAF